MIATVLPVLQLVLSFGNICILIYGGFKFLNKPHDTLEQKVNEHEVRIKDLERSLAGGRNRVEERFNEQDATNEVLVSSVLALIEFEIQYCLTENKAPSKELEKARENLHSYLAKK